MKSSLDNIFYKVVYHHIIYMCDFFWEFKQLFCRSLHEFSRGCGFHHICSYLCMAMEQRGNMVWYIEWILMIPSSD